MRRCMLALAAVALAVTAAGADQTTAPAVEVATVESGTLKGSPSVLAWSTDDRSLYLQAADRDHFNHVKSTTHFVVSIADRSVKAIEGEPQWASAYWGWKSGRRSPAAPASMLDVQVDQKGFRSTNVPTGGDLARGGTDTGMKAEDVWSAAYQSQTATVYVLTWNRVTIGRWVNEPLVPGTTYSWAPPPRVALAFAPRDGGPVTIVEKDGRTDTLAGSRSAILPAWANDGTKIAWVERRDKKHFAIVVADAPGDR